MTTLAEPTLTMTVGIHPASLPESPAATTPARRLRVDARTSTEQLLRQRADLPADHPDCDRLRARAIEQNLPLANRLARRYAGRGELLDDLAQVAALALVNAVDRYDPGRQVPFPAYAVPGILGALKRHFRDTAWAMRVPRPTQELAQQAATATRDLTQQRGRPPTPAELADHLNVDIEALRAATAAWHLYRLPSLNTSHSGTVGLDLIDILGCIDTGYTAVDNRLSLQPFIAALPTRERQILTMRFYGHLTQTQIATEIGLSQMHMSRLLKQTLTRLRAAMSI